MIPILRSTLLESSSREKPVVNGMPTEKYELYFILKIYLGENTKPKEHTTRYSGKGCMVILIPVPTLRVWEKIWLERQNAIITREQLLTNKNFKQPTKFHVNMKLRFDLLHINPERYCRLNNSVSFENLFLFFLLDRNHFIDKWILNCY